MKLGQSSRAEILENLSQTNTNCDQSGGPPIVAVGLGSIGAQKSMHSNHRFDSNPTAKSQYFGTPGKEIGRVSPVNVKPVSTAKAPPPKHNNFFLQKNNSSKKNTGAILSGTLCESQKSKASKGSQEQLSKQSSSVSSKRFGSIITISDNLQGQPPPFNHKKSSMLKPSTIDKSTGSSNINCKIIRPSDKAIPFSSASQEVNTAQVSKGQGYRSHTLGSQQSQQVITKEGTEKTTCVASSEQLSNAISSQHKGKSSLRDILTGDHSVKHGKVESSGNMFDSYGNSSLQVPITQSIVRGNNGAFSKKLKAHRDVAPATTTFSQEGELLQNTFRMFQTEMSQGRAAQRYASVDKEDFESHISLSSCVSEGGKQKKTNLESEFPWHQIWMTAVVNKETFQQMHSKNVADFYLTLTPKDPIEGQNRSSLTPNSKTTSSYRDSESLGFALSERKKVHQLKQLQLRQLQLQKKLGSVRDGGQLLNMGTQEQIMFQKAMEKVNAATIAAGQDMRSNLLLQLPERALLQQHLRMSGDPNELKQAAARTLQRLQFEQNSESPNFKELPLKREDHNSHLNTYPTQHVGSMIAIQEQQDSEDSQSRLVLSPQSLLQKDSHVLEISISPTKLNASRSKQKKKIIDREVIKYFKRMVKNQQIDKFKAQMNSQSMVDIKEERNQSPRQHQRGRQQLQKKVQLVQKPWKDQLNSMSSNEQQIIVESQTLDATNHQSHSQELQPYKQSKKSLKQKQQKPEIMANFFTTQQILKSTDTQSTELRSLDPQNRPSDLTNTRQSVPRLPLELLKREQTPDEQVINIVTGGSFGRQQMPNHCSSTQRPLCEAPETKVIPKQQPPDNTTERLEFQRTLKKAIVSLQQLQLATKSTTGETPYNNHIKPYKSNRPERNLSNTSYGTQKHKKQTFPGKSYHHKSSLSCQNVSVLIENGSQQQSQRDRLESIKSGPKQPQKKELKRKEANSMSPSGEDREEVVELPTLKKDEQLIFSLQHLKEPSGTPTVNLKKLVNQDSKTMAENGASGGDYIQCNTVKHASSFARDVCTFDTFGRPSAQSQEQRKKSPSILENSPIKDVERLETLTNDASIGKLSKKKKLKQLIPKPENSKRLRKTIKTKKKQTEQRKMLSAGVNTAPGSLVGSKRCSTSHFGIQKSQQSSCAASKESSKRQSMVSSQSKRSPQQQSEAIHQINSEKAFKFQPSSTGVSTTPIQRKSLLKKIGGSGSILEVRKQPNLQRETCMPQNELKKKMGHIFKLQQPSTLEQTLESTSNINKMNSVHKTANATISKRRRQSIAESYSIGQQSQVIQKSQQPTLDMFSPKGLKREPKSRPSNKESGNSQLGYLYSQLNTLLTKKESGVLSVTKERKTPKNHKNQKIKQKTSLQVQQTASQLSNLSQPNGAIIEKKIKLNVMAVNGRAESSQVLGSSATQQHIAIVHPHPSKIIEVQTPQTHVALSKPSHSRKKSEALLKKSNSSQQLLIDSNIRWQWQQMTQQQAPNTTATANQSGIQKLKKAIIQDSSSRKVDLMQPISSLFISNQGKSSGKDSATIQGRAGKSRNISDQCYQRDQVSEYNITSQGKLLYKTSGPVGGSRNSKQQFGTLGGLQTSTNNAQQYSSHSSLLKNNKDSQNHQLLETSSIGQVLSNKELASGNSSQPHLQRESNLLRKLGNTQEHYQSQKKNILSSTQTNLERPQLQVSTKQSSKNPQKMKRQESAGPVVVSTTTGGTKTSSRNRGVTGSFKIQ